MSLAGAGGPSAWVSSARHQSTFGTSPPWDTCCDRAVSRRARSRRARRGGPGEGRIVLKDGGRQLGRNRGRRPDARWASGSCGSGRPTWRCAGWPEARAVAVSQGTRAFAAAACACLALTASGCNGEEEREDRKISLAERQAQLDRDPYAI